MIIHETIAHIKVNCGESPSVAKFPSFSPIKEEVEKQSQSKNSISYKRKHQLKDKIE